MTNKKRSMVIGTVMQLVVLAILFPYMAMVVGWLPKGPDMLANIMVETLGTLDIFEGWVDLLSQYNWNGAAPITSGQVVNQLCLLLSNSVLEALLIGTVVLFAQKLIPVSGLPILSSFIGVVCGVVLLKAFDLTGSKSVSAAMTGVATIGLQIFGIVIMLRSTTKSTRYERRVVKRALTKTIIGLIVSAIISVGVCGAAASLSQVAIVAKSPTGFPAAKTWYLILIVIICVCAVFLFLMDRFYEAVRQDENRDAQRARYRWD